MTDTPGSPTVRYRTVWATHQARRLLLGGCLGRLSLGLLPLSLLLTVRHSTGSFTVAGAAIGAFGAGNVAASPLRAKALDHRGHRTTLAVLTGAYCAALAVAILLPPARHGTWVPVASAAVAGATLPPFGISMRLLLADLNAAPGWREWVYAIDATTEELSRTIGPLLAGAAVTIATPSAGLAAVVILDLTAAAAMFRPAASRAATRHHHVSQPSKSDAPVRVLRHRGFALTLALLIAAGIVLGVLDVATVAVSAGQHHSSASGPLLAVLSAGSALGGVLYGRHRWRRPPAHRLIVACAILAALTATLAVASNLLALGALLFLAGRPSAPSSSPPTCSPTTSSNPLATLEPQPGSTPAATPESRPAPPSPEASPNISAPRRRSPPLQSYSPLRPSSHVVCR